MLTCNLPVELGFCYPVPMDNDFFGPTQVWYQDQVSGLLRTGLRFDSIPGRRLTVNIPFLSPSDSNWSSGQLNLIWTSSGSGSAAFSLDVYAWGNGQYERSHQEDWSQSFSFSMNSTGSTSYNITSIPLSGLPIYPLRFLIFSLNRINPTGSPDTLNSPIILLNSELAFNVTSGTYSYVWSPANSLLNSDFFTTSMLSLNGVRLLSKKINTGSKFSLDFSTPSNFNGSVSLTFPVIYNIGSSNLNFTFSWAASGFPVNSAPIYSNGNFNFQVPGIQGNAFDSLDFIPVNISVPTSGSCDIHIEFTGTSLDAPLQILGWLGNFSVAAIPKRRILGPAFTEQTSGNAIYSSPGIVSLNQNSKVSYPFVIPGDLSGGATVDIFYSLAGTNQATLYVSLSGGSQSPSSVSATGNNIGVISFPLSISSPAGTDSTLILSRTTDSTTNPVLIKSVVIRYA